MNNQIPTVAVNSYDIEDGVLTVSGIAPAEASINGSTDTYEFTLPIPFIRMHYHKQDSPEEALLIEGGDTQVLRFSSPEIAAMFHSELTNNLMDFYAAGDVQDSDDGNNGLERDTGGREN